MLKSKESSAKYNYYFSVDNIVLFNKYIHEESPACCADMNCHWYGYIYKFTVYKFLIFFKY